MQDHPGAPGTARQGSTRTIVSTNRGGKATQPRAPGHERPLTAQRAARHGRLSADSGAPGADVPLATTAGAPGHHCLSAALRAPGHGRPLATTAQGAGASPSECRAYRHRALAGPRAPAAPGNLAPHPATPNTLTYPHSRSHRRRKPPSIPTLLPPNPAPPPIKCILPPKFRPARGLAPPRVRASPYATTPAPRPRPPFPFPAREGAAGGEVPAPYSPSPPPRCEAPTIPSAFYW